MRTLLALSIAVLALAPAHAQKKNAGSSAKPKLAVSIVVDQMRADY